MECGIVSITVVQHFMRKKPFSAFNKRRKKTTEERQARSKIIYSTHIYVCIFRDAYIFYSYMYQTTYSIQHVHAWNAFGRHSTYIAKMSNWMS